MDSKAYACYSKNEEIRAGSSSGGIYYQLAHEILKTGGIVFAACYDGLKVKHKRISDEQELLESLGSKYLPSELEETFSAVKNELSMGKLVLFTGLPCQCAGLVKFIDNCSMNFSNLITVDVVCHGVPSKIAWEHYCTSMKASGFDFISVNMRDKSSGWKNYSLRFSDSDRRTVIQPHTSNLYMKGYISNIYLRPSCYACKFKGLKRKTDITLGDFWGIGNFNPEMDDDKGTSLALINTETGQKLFDAISCSIVFEQMTIEQAVRYNPSIISSSPVTKKRESFFRQLIDGKDFQKIVGKMTKTPISVYVKKIVKDSISNFKEF